MYATDPSSVSTSLQNSSPSTFSNQTIDLILKMATRDNTNINYDKVTPDQSGNVTVAAGAEIVVVATSGTGQTTIKPPVSAPVVVFEGKGGVKASFNDDPNHKASAPGVVDRVIVGSEGRDDIVVLGASNNQIVLGDGDRVKLGGGHDTVIAGLGVSTIEGGTGGFGVVTMTGKASDYNVSTAGGVVMIAATSGTKVVDITKIQYVQLDQGKAMIFAKDSVEAAVSTLYQTAFGRTAEAGGLDYWFDLARGGASLKQIATAFTQTAEFAKVASMSNADFVVGVYQNTFGRAPEDAGLAYWTDALNHGSTRADVICSFAQIGADNIAGTNHTEANIVGSVTIVQGII